MIIGIGGISRSGKSFLAAALRKMYEDQGKRIAVIDQDDYVLPSAEIPLIRGHVDWEIPESIDWKRLKSAVKRADEKFEIVIVEGLMIFYNRAITKMVNLSVFIELDYQGFLERKRKDLRWGQEPDWYIEHIWQSHQLYGKMPEGMKPDFILDGSADFDVPQLFSKMSQRSDYGSIPSRTRIK